MTEAVLDAGPLIHLAELGALDVLSDFDLLRVPQAVWDEVTVYQPEALSAHGLRLKRFSGTTSSPELETISRALALDRGELQALILLEENPQALFLTDDAAARLAAEERGYRVHGTIGLLIRSARRKQRTQQEVIELIRSIPKRSTLFIRSSLLDDVIRRLEGDWFKTK